VVRARRLAAEVVYAAVFPDLPPGDYLPYGGWAAPQGSLTVTAGQVLETEWGETGCRETGCGEGP
jgi:hypothetical protein